MIAVVSVFFFVYHLFSLFLVPLTRTYWCIEIDTCCVKLIIKSVSDNSVNFVGKWREFQFESLFRVSSLLCMSSVYF